MERLQDLNNNIDQHPGQPSGTNGSITSALVSTKQSGRSNSRDRKQDCAEPPPGSIGGKAPPRLHAVPTKSMLTEGLPGTRSNDFCVFESRKFDLIFPRL